MNPPEQQVERVTTDYFLKKPESSPEAPIMLLSLIIFLISACIVSLIIFSIWGSNSHNPAVTNSTIQSPLISQATIIAQNHSSPTLSLLHTYGGHIRSVSGVAFAPDGKTILTSSFDTTAIFWNVATGQKLHPLSENASIYSAAFSPDGKTILIGDSDKTVTIWDTVNGQKLRVFSGHTDQVSSVSFSPDGMTILSASWDNTAILRDLTTGQQLRTLSEDTAILCASFSPDGKTILIGTKAGTATLWETLSGRKLRTFDGHTAAVRSTALSPDGKTALTSAASRK